MTAIRTSRLTLRPVLYIDDDRDIGAAVDAALADQGLAVRWEASGRDITRCCLEVQPQLIILDVNMPDRNGPEVLAELRACGFYHPVLFATAESNGSLLEYLGKLDALAVMRKPFRLPVLGRQLMRVWDQVNA